MEVYNKWGLISLLYYRPGHYMEYIYLIETNESVRCGDNVYKIGRTTQALEKRLSSYTGDIHIKHYQKCENCVDAEMDLLEIFNMKYKLIRGREWFHGDVDDMKQTIISYFNEKNKPTIIDLVVKDYMESSFFSKSANHIK